MIQNNVVVIMLPLHSLIQCDNGLVIISVSITFIDDVKNSYSLFFYWSLFVLADASLFEELKLWGKEGGSKNAIDKAIIDFSEFIKNGLKKKVVQLCGPNYVSTNYNKLELQTAHQHIVCPEVIS